MKDLSLKKINIKIEIEHKPKKKGFLDFLVESFKEREDKYNKLVSMYDNLSEINKLSVIDIQKEIISASEAMEYIKEIDDI